MQLFGTTNPATAKPCGIFWIVADEPVYLPLEQADIHADIVDLSAIVTVTQQFWQYSSGGLQRAKYVFPVPARAAVCGFEMSAEDGTVITAVSKEKEEAKREHAAAIASGQMTGLVEHVTDDAFLISLGALPAMQTITCQLTYVIDLLDDDVSDQVRLQIPVSVGMRYGVLPAGIITARQTPPHRVAISADVYTTGAVKSITSPTHPDLTATSEDSQSASWHAGYTSPDFLSRDFVLSVVAEGLDAPRCVAQRTEEGHVVMQLALVPKFKLPPIHAQEYIFLVDRSGSMAGDRIETAKRGLMMLLRSLPAQGTTFNIFSFGRKCSGLWPKSMEYNEHTLGLATQHVDSMMPNFGGTEICSALEQVFRSRQHVVPTACFVLTDGESWDTQQTIDSVSLATRSASPEAPLRVFTLGIGNTTSTEMCEGIARAGNGICLMAVGPESIIGKCAKLVRAGRTYILRNVKIDWGINNPDPNVVRQGPAQVDAIYPGNRLLVFNLIESKDIRVPEEVVISAQRDGEGEVLRFAVPVQRVRDMSAGKSHHGTRLIHVLAARRIITDLEDNSKANVSPDAKALITRLGIEYQLASRFTSFIAVDKRDMRPLTEQFEASVASPQNPSGPRLLMAYKNAASLFGRASREREGEGDRKRKRRRSVVVGNPANNALDESLQHSPLPSMDEELFDLAEPTSAAPPPPPGVSLFKYSASAEQSYSSSATFDAASPQSSPDEDALLSGLSENPRKKKKKSIASPSSPIFPLVPPPSCAFSPPASGASPPPAISALGAPPARIRAFPAPRQSFGTPSASSSPDDRVANLVRLQSFDGSFAASENLGLIVGAEHLGQAAAQKVDEKVWATALAVAYLKLYMKGQPELLDGLVEKAIAFLEGAVDDVDGWLVRAERLVGQP